MKSLTIPKSVVKIGESAFGYYFDTDTFAQKISGFTVYGTKGSAAEKYANDNGFKFVEKIDNIPVSGITLSKTSMTIKKGSSASLKAAVLPSNATDKTVKWETNKSHIASVDKTGLIKANSCGTAIITAKTSSGKTAVCNVTVYEPLKNNSEISTSDVTVHSPITLTGKAAGGTAPYKFAYYYKKAAAGTWTRAYVTQSGSAYTTKTSVSFKPASAGVYNVRINVKDDNGTVVQKNFNLTANSSALELPATPIV